jgi:hypothetical protein
MPKNVPASEQYLLLVIGIVLTDFRFFEEGIFFIGDFLELNLGWYESVEPLKESLALQLKVFLLDNCPCDVVV